MSFRTPSIRFVIASLALAFAPLTAAADVKLPAVLADHMVVQRNKPVHVWGMANPSEAVQVSFRDHSASATADASGKWSVDLPKGEAGGPFTMTIKASNTITLKDVLVGDVWFIAGQSNVEFPMGRTTRPDADPRGKGDLAAAHFPDFRIMHAAVVTVDQPQFSTVNTTPWTAVDPSSLEKFSAIGYYFGRDLIKAEKIPIGLIESATGGSAAESWVSPAALAADHTLTRGLPSNGDVNNEEDHPAKGKKVDALTAGEIKRGNGVNIPGRCFNGMVAPLTPFHITGVVWYHGASNSNPDERARNYGHLMKGLITDWRKQWNDGDFPFLEVEIANRQSKSNLAAVREGQFLTYSLPNVGLVVTIDIGVPTEYHPPDKMDIGSRAALWAEHFAHPDKSFEYSGPIFTGATTKGNSIVASFTHADGMTAKGGTLTEWEVAGADGNFKPATATIDGTTVVAISSAVKSPKYVRYDYSSSPPTTLYNAAGLPASPFTSKPEE